LCFGFILPAYRAKDGEAGTIINGYVRQPREDHVLLPLLIERLEKRKG